MIIKPFEEQSRAITRLEDRLAGATAEGERRDLSGELRRRRAGHAAERRTAHLLDSIFGVSPNRCVLHGLRISHRGRIAQIDHLLINRCLEIYVIETKSRATGLEVNEHGEFSTVQDGRRIGVASPIEQAERQAAVLRDLLGSGRVWRPRRLGLRRPIHVRTAVAVHENTHVERPAKGRPLGLDRVVRSDALHRLYDRDAGFDRPWWRPKIGRTDLQFAASLGSRRTMECFARSIADQHELAPAAAARWAGDMAAGVGSRPVEPHRCARCDEALTKGVVDYCRIRHDRFGGQLLCMSCQGQSGTRFQYGEGMSEAPAREIVVQTR